MENNSGKSPWLVLLAVAAAAGVGLVFGTGLGAWLLMACHAGEGSAADVLTNPTADARMVLFGGQAVTALFGFFIVPALAWWRMTHRPVSSLFAAGLSARAALLVVLMVIAFAVVDSVIIQWNKNMVLPDFLSGFELWAKAKEAELERLTHLLIDFESVNEMVLGFVVIAVVAGVTEEFLFRGLVQTELARALGSRHAAVWLAAILFSAIHLQFYGFVPRLLLGALFGYLFVWSGSLWAPMLAHIANNAFALLVVRLSQTQRIPVDLENEAVPLPVAIAFLVIFAVLLSRCYRLFKTEAPS
jgi:membrane protease YdiL (CAAX protease family)